MQRIALVQPKLLSIAAVALGVVFAQSISEARSGCQAGYVPCPLQCPGCVRYIEGCYACCNGGACRHCQCTGTECLQNPG